MTENIEPTKNEKSTEFPQRVKQSIPALFMVWLVLTVLSPLQDLYKAYFFLIIVPAGLILIVTRQSGIDWKDPFLRTALVFFAYAGITTLFIGLGPIENQIRAFRWAVEISFGILALFIWMPSVIKSPDRWGRFFLWMALSGSLAAIALFVFYHELEGPYGRMTGFGALYHWVTGAYILLLYSALGHFLITRSAKKLSSKDMMIVALTFLTVCIAVLLFQSRTAIAAMLIYALFLLLIQFINQPRRAVYVALLSLTGMMLVLATVYHSYGFDGFIERLLNRGMSNRVDIWTGYWLFMSESWLLGFGSGTEAEYHPAAAGYWQPNNYVVVHPHSVLLGTLVDTGVIGLAFLAVLIYLLVRVIVRQSSATEEKIRLFGILGLIFMITLTGGQTIISSIKAVWLYLWIPVIFIWFWSNCRIKNR